MHFLAQGFRTTVEGEDYPATAAAADLLHLADRAPPAFRPTAMALCQEDPPCPCDCGDPRAGRVHLRDQPASGIRGSIRGSPSLRPPQLPLRVRPSEARVRGDLRSSLDVKLLRR